MKCPELQELTETEPCSLEEEYFYQKDWEHDNQRTSKYPQILNTTYIKCYDVLPELIKLIRLKDTGKLIGDVNLFFQADGSIEINLMISGQFNVIY